MVSILEKMRTPAAKFEVALEADRHRTEPRYLTSARMLFDVWGDGITPDKLVRAINLSISKYCSVYHSLRDDLKLRPQFRIHATGAEVQEIIRWLRWPRRRPNSIYLRFVGSRPLKASFFLHHCEKNEEEIVGRRPQVDNQSDRFVLV